MALPKPDPRPLVIQRTAAPTRKLAATVGGGGAAGFVLYVLELVGLPPMDPTVAAWVAVTIGGIIGYFVRDRANT